MSLSEEHIDKLNFLFFSQELLAQQKEQIKNKKLLGYHDVQKIKEINEKLDRIEIDIFSLTT